MVFLGEWDRAPEELEDIGHELVKGPVIVVLLRRGRLMHVEKGNRDMFAVKGSHHVWDVCKV